jgi:hypothetical protein
MSVVYQDGGTTLKTSYVVPVDETGCVESAILICPATSL